MRTRAYRRHQRVRIKARHLYFIRFVRPWGYEGFVPKDIAIRHPADCGRRCLLCHWDKFVEPRRAREAREWRKEWIQED